MTIQYLERMAEKWIDEAVGDDSTKQIVATTIKGFIDYLKEQQK